MSAQATQPGEPVSHQRIEIIAGPLKGKRGRVIGRLQLCEQKEFALVVVDHETFSREIPVDHVKELRT